MINFSTRIILLSALCMILVGGFRLPTLAKFKDSVKAKTDVNSKSSVNPDKINKTKNKIRGESVSPPILFEENKGQFARNIKFVSRADDYNFYVSQTEAVFSIPNLKHPGKSPFTLNMRWLGANADSEIKGLEKAITKSGYYIGNDENKWLTDISNFQQVIVNRTYQGIDIVFRSSEQKLEYDFIISPNADTDLIKLEFDGIKNVNVDRRGNLIFKFNGAELRHQKPFAYQMINGEKRQIEVGYVKKGKNTIGFKIGDYDKTKKLIIDPTVYATYLGGTEGSGDVNDIAVDRNGYIYTASDERIQLNRLTGIRRSFTKTNRDKIIG